VKKILKGVNFGKSITLNQQHQSDDLKYSFLFLYSFNCYHKQTVSWHFFHQKNADKMIFNDRYFLLSFFMQQSGANAGNNAKLILEENEGRSNGLKSNWQLLGNWSLLQQFFNDYCVTPFVNFSGIFRLLWLFLWLHTYLLKGLNFFSSSRVQ